MPLSGRIRQILFLNFISLDVGAKATPFYLLDYVTETDVFFRIGDRQKNKVKITS